MLKIQLHKNVVMSVQRLLMNLRPTLQLD